MTVVDCALLRDQIRQIREWAEAATSGPWVFQDPGWMTGGALSGQGGALVAMLPPLSQPQHRGTTNGRYIACWSPDVVVALTALWETQVDGYEQTLRYHRDDDTHDGWCAHPCPDFTRAQAALGALAGLVDTIHGGNHA